MEYRITHTTDYRYTDPVAVCHNVVHLAPRNMLTQRCFDHRVIVRPKPAAIVRRTDFFGNVEHYFAIQRPHRRLMVKSISHIEVIVKPPVIPSLSPSWEHMVQRLCRADGHDCLDAMQFCIDSPSIHSFPALREYAALSFSPGKPIVSAVLDLTARIFHDFKYDPTATTVNSPLEEVLESRRGVCQDFAHLQIGCLRSLGLAARYVSGYIRTMPPPGKPRLIGADASHAWLSVFCGEMGWIDFDPTNNTMASDQHITTAWGRDYTDVCPIKGVFIGGGQHTMAISVDVMPEEEFDTTGGYAATAG
ncbi:transglutaminase family protein [Planctopirus hydrillae]|uniref:Transglutaminase n=1 Tax=Planctopirus hydrillae TaxID=1841610 RepID=A0A1C3E7E8_9PLAN|nr:transglutaminase family protein [Planctopirus hydrillae]ODA29151.1 transglutaminase [Planctopirus hydrillae]